MPYADPQQQRSYQREWIARRRAEWLADKACIDCGSTERLEVDHIDPKTKLSHAVWSWSAKRREAELAKCVVRCLKCHRSRHNPLRERCSKGHAFTPDNTYIDPSDGHRRCRACRSERGRKRRERGRT